MVPVSAAGLRLDQVAADLFPEFSRSKLQSWIKQGHLTVNGEKSKAKAKLVGGEELRLALELEPEGEWIAEDIPLDIVFEDESILVINKPVGLVVHPAAGNWHGTLLNALLFHNPDQALLPRAGIVHRLDKDTSGLLVVAKTLGAQNSLVQQLQSRSMSRTYHAVAFGEVDRNGIVDAPIGRHPNQRTKMAVVKSGGKEATTHYSVLQRFTCATYIELKLETGRTHQIRVHMAHIGNSLVGDQTYKASLPAKMKKEYPVLSECEAFPRQALHAKKLGLEHPISAEYMEWETELPEDFEALLTTLRDSL